MEDKAKKIYRTFTGLVVSARMTKTIVVRVDTMKMNTKYQKKYRVSKKYHVHDEKNEAKMGETVTFVECRPLSKTKRWRLVSIKK
jgi:small subunit ribosomal protein S17